jgi:uncharacterized protein YydD (DUF2326 family)
MATTPIPGSHEPDSASAEKLKRDWRGSVPRPPHSELTARQRLDAAFRGLLAAIIVRSREVFSTPTERGQLNGGPFMLDPFTLYGCGRSG